MPELVLEPGVPPPGLALLFVIGCVLLVAQQRRERRATLRLATRRGGACWLAAYLGCLALLANPTWLERREEPGRAKRVVLVDVSRSMETPDAGGKPRIEVARALAQELAADPGADTRLIAFDARARPLNPGELPALAADGASTDLAEALRAGLAAHGEGREELVLITDGADGGPGGTDALLREAALARMRGMAVVAVPLGGPTAAPDLALALDAPADVALVGEELSLRVRLTQRGFDRATAAVSVTEDSRAAGESDPAVQNRWTVGVDGGSPAARPALRAGSGQPITRKSVTLAGAETVVDLPVPALPAGAHELSVRVEPLPGERVTANNARTLTLHVLEQPVRVLVLEGKPYWDLPFLVRQIAARRGIAVTVMVRFSATRVVVREPGTAAGRDLRAVSDAPLPKSLGTAGLDPFDVVVLGHDTEAFLADGGLELLRTWIARRGGSLVCARGRPTPEDSAALARLMPVRWDATTPDRFHLQLTGEGRALRLVPDALEATLAEADGPSTSERVVATSELAAVIARASGGALDGMPVIAAQPYGAGRVVSVEGSGRWRTALRAPSADGAHAAHRAFWMGLLRWLVTSGHTLPGVDVSIIPERSPVPLGEPVRVLVRARDPALFAPGAPPQLAVDAPTGRTVTAAPVAGEPGVYRADLGALPAGRHRVAVAAKARCVVEVEAPVAEDLDRSARPELLARLARETGGEVVPPEAARVREACSRAWSLAHPVSYRRTPAWDRPLVLCLIVAAWVAGWVLRRREGLT